MKQGYTFYPKDWNTSEAVFELTLEERGFYRELIDLAMLNDNKTEIKLRVWARKFNSDINTLENILSRLKALKLINTDEYLFIPSCEPRLNLIRGGRKGGLNKSNTKPISKPSVKPTSKPMVKQNKIKVKENKYREFDHLKLTQDEFEKLNNDYTKEQIDEVLDSIQNYSKNKSYKSLYLTAGKWLKKQFPKKEEEQSEIYKVLNGTATPRTYKGDWR